MKYLEKMKLNNFLMHPLFLLALMFTTVFIAAGVVTKQFDDPPKEKKSKKDTTKIDIKQMQQKNISVGKRSLELDSLIMQLDSLSKAKKK